MRRLTMWLLVFFLLLSTSTYAALTYETLTQPKPGTGGTGSNTRWNGYMFTVASNATSATLWNVTLITIPTTSVTGKWACALYNGTTFVVVVNATADNTTQWQCQFNGTPLLTQKEYRVIAGNATLPTTTAYNGSFATAPASANNGQFFTINTSAVNQNAVGYDGATWITNGGFIYNIWTIQIANGTPSVGNFTVSVNDTRTSSFISGFNWNYTTSNSSDTNTKSGYCSTTTCSVTNFTGTLNVTVFNVSGGTYFDPYDSPRLSYVYNTTQTNIALSTFKNSLNVNLSNIVNNSGIGTFCTNVSNTTYSQASCTSSGLLTFYNVSGNTTLLWYGVGNGTYFNASMNIGIFNATNTNYTNITFQSLLNLSVYQLFTNTTITGYNTTNNLVSNKTASLTYAIIQANAGSNNVQIDVAGNYSQNLTCTATSLTLTSCQLSGVYDDLFTIGAKTSTNAFVQNFTVNVTNTTLGGTLYSQNTTNGSITFPLLQGYYYNFFISPVNFSINNATLPANASTNLFNFTVFTINTLNVTFYNEQNGSIVNGTNITLNLVSTPQSAVYYTTNGTILTQVLSPSAYNVQYLATGYVTRTYQFTLVNNTYVVLRLPMLLSTAATAVTVTVVDNTGTLLSNATVKLYLYDITTNTYNVNQIFTSNDQGIGLVNVQLNTPTYYFTVDYQGSTRLITTPSPIYGSTVQLTVPLNVPGFTNLFDNNHLAGSISNTTPTTFTFLWTDSDNTATQGCLYAYQLTSTNQVLYNSTCSSSSSGSVSTSLNLTNATYYLYGVVTKGGNEYVLDTDIVTYATTPPTEPATKLWLLVMLLITIIIVFIFRETPSLALIGVGLVPLLFSGAHLIGFGLGYTIPLFLILCIIAIIVGDR